MKQDEQLLPANTHQKCQVTRADLPLSCPMPLMRVWNSHPRVYLAIEKTGKAFCPYCGTEYILVSENSSVR